MGVGLNSVPAERRAKATEVLRGILEGAIEDYNHEKSAGGYEADRYKARGKVEAIADTWDALYDAGLADMRDIKVYEG